VTVTRLVLVAALLLPTVAAAQNPPSSMVLTTKYFAFHSDLPNNVNDALVAAASARRAKRPDPFASGSEKACIDGLPSAEREQWERAVVYYTESKATNFQIVLLRFKLAGLPQRYGMDDTSNLQYLEEIAAVIEAATPAYVKCLWSTQDGLNRQWIDRVKPLLDRYETSLGEEFPRLLQASWTGLPFRVDVVNTASLAGANAASTDSSMSHIRISSTNPSNQERAALEVAFHEAAHALTAPGSPLSTALASAAKASGGALPQMDLVHAVHFFITGDAVRRAFARAGEPQYTPYLYALKLFPEQFRDSAARIWPAFMDGTRTMAQAAEEQVRALATAAKSN
jgi:hypothetical protein